MSDELHPIEQVLGELHVEFHATGHKGPARTVAEAERAAELESEAHAHATGSKGAAGAVEVEGKTNVG